jgi:uncharacterized protein HemY
MEQAAKKINEAIILIATGNYSEAERILDKIIPASESQSGAVYGLHKVCMAAQDERFLEELRMS